MRLPNAENAYVDKRKLIEYALSFDHPRGRHKARVFRSALGITEDRVDDLARGILSSVHEAECVAGETDPYGQRYTVDCRIETEAGDAIVRTGWIIRRNENFPRLTTCFVL